MPITLRPMIFYISYYQIYQIQWIGCVHRNTLQMQIVSKKSGKIIVIIAKGIYVSNFI